MKKLSLFIFSVLIISFLPVNTAAHCQVPCGIYGDQTRFDLLEEHITTLEKSMQEIIKLSKEGEKNYNQIVRWVVNKDKHAEEIDNILTYYFLTQRIKPVDSKDKDEYQKYQAKLELIHHILVYNMKAKQTVDLDNIQKLRSLLSEFKTLYMNHEQKGTK
jgi:nickel superoxide dismutase